MRVVLLHSPRHSVQVGEGGQRQHTVSVRGLAEPLSDRSRGDHGGETRRMVDCGRPLDPAVVGSADGTDATVAPLLLCDPCQRVEPVGAFVEERSPDTVGVVPTPNVLADRGVTRRRQSDRRSQHEVALLVVRGPLDDHGVRTISRFGRWEVEVGRQERTVAHRHPEAPAMTDSPAEFLELLPVQRIGCGAKTTLILLHRVAHRPLR